MTLFGPRPSQVIRKEISDLRHYLDGLPKNLRKSGALKSYEERLENLEKELRDAKMVEHVRKKGRPRTLGSRILAVRGDMDQAEFADVLRVKPAQVSRYETDKETPSPKVLHRIGQFSGKSVEWLLTGSDALTKGTPMDVQRLAAKTTKGLSKEDLVDVAAGYLKDTKIAEADEFNAMMKGLFADRKTLRRVLNFYRDLRLDDVSPRSGK
jgi:transcriptional regulator with XRE-family HTH domain